MEELQNKVEELAEIYATDESGHFDLQSYTAFKEGAMLMLKMWSSSLDKLVSEIE